MFRRILPFGILAGLLTACGGNLGSLVKSSDSLPEKKPCPGDHPGFFVCMSDDSSVDDVALKDTISKALAGLATLVNSAAFQNQIASGLDDGKSVDSALTGANYIVSISDYCDTSSSGDTVLAQAVVGGDSIQYNRCTYGKDASGNPDLAEISGVLLHEISHNLGYTHPDVNPSRSTVPYYLGDTATSDLGGSSSGTYQSPTVASSGGFEPSAAGPQSTSANPYSRHRARNTWRD